MKEVREFIVNKNNFDQLIQNLPFGEGNQIIFEDEESFVKFHMLVGDIFCKERSRQLLIHETYMKCFHNGYIATFKDCGVNAEICIPNPNFGEKDRFQGTTQIFGALEGDEDGNVDITPLILSYLKSVQENPESDVRAKITGWRRCLHFNADLLGRPIPKDIIKLFTNGKGAK